jgi:hypothetical protein
MALNRPAETALPPSASHQQLISSDPSLTPPAHLAAPATPQASAGSADPIPTFSPPSSWSRTDLSGIGFYTAESWTNGFPDQLPSDSPNYLCLLPSGVTPEGMAMCRGNALSFSLGPAQLNSEADWRRQIGISVKWTGPNIDPGSVPGSFTRVGTAYVGGHKAIYREFLFNNPDGSTRALRAWWLPVTKLWIFSSVDTGYDTVVDHMLATFDFAGFHQPTQ